ncbi:MAG: TrkH family potassium uptake protein [Desulfobacterales bacterium]
MRWGYVLHVTGLLVLVIGAALLLPLGLALLGGEAAAGPFALSAGLSIGCGLVMHLTLRREQAEVLTSREGMAIVSCGWIAAAVFGALPFRFALGLSWTDALFESVSGFTTTGSTIIADIEVLPRSLIVWRSFIQWLGGMGIIVLSIAILPFLKVGGMQLYKAEAPTPVPDRLRPHMRDTAKVLWKVYVLFTAAEAALLAAGGMGLFDAVNHALTTLPTGGFSPWNASIEHFGSLYVDLVILGFMVLAGINFSLHYRLLRGEGLAFWRDAECRFYLGLVAALVAGVAVSIHGTVYAGWGEALRYGAFQVASILTTTGYATADYDRWPDTARLLLFGCMFIGACAGSTGGGMKCLRVIVALKHCYRELYLLIHPHAVSRLKLGGRVVTEEIAHSILAFVALYVLLFAAGALLLSLSGLDLVSAAGAAATALGNTGPGFGAVGPSQTFAPLSDPAKGVLIVLMLLGRLEIYTLLILVVPEFYRK